MVKICWMELLKLNFEIISKNAFSLHPTVQVDWPELFCLTIPQYCILILRVLYKKISKCYLDICENKKQILWDEIFPSGQSVWVPKQIYCNIRGFNPAPSVTVESK